MAREGKLIVLESVDDTILRFQIQRLYRWLNERGVPVEHTAEPTGGPVGAQLLLYRQGRLRIDPLSRALYDVADRMDHLGRADGILSWLAGGRDVLCARYVAYSCACHFDQVDLPWLLKINARCRPPDLTLFIDVEPDLETSGLYENYRRVVVALRSKGQHVVTVDGRGSEDQLFERCCRHVAALDSPPLGTARGGVE